MSEQPSKITPNTFQNPNVLVDDYMRYLTGNETKCYLVVVRKTLGWLKRRDCISLSQITTLSGIGDGPAREAMKALCQFGLVIKTAENDPLKNYGPEYELELDDMKVSMAALIARHAEKESASKNQTSKARAAAKSKNNPPLPTIPPDVEQTPPPDVEQTTQKPLSKASINNNKENTSVETPTPASTSQFSGQEISDNLKLLIRLRNENLPGMLTPIMAQELAEAAAIFPGAWYEEAFKSAVLGEARNWKYIRAILQNRLDGKEYQPKKKQYAQKAPQPATKAFAL